MPKEFWSEYRTAAGVFTIGEVFNGDPKYVSGYQGALDATLNYPMYYKLQAAFQQRKSMYNIHNGVNAEVCAYIRMWIHTHTHTHTQAYTCAQTHTHASMHAHTRAHAL